MLYPIARLCFVLGATSACSGPADPSWRVVGENLPSALLSVWGRSASDVYAVGGDNGGGPVVLHYDGTGWTQLATGQTGNLWWVTGFDDGPIYVGGDGGTILRYADGSFTRMTTPGTDTVFGIWGASPDDVWAVGGAAGGAGGAFAWRLQNGTWTPQTLPTDLAATSALWKMYGRSATDAWIVGTNGTALRWDGAALTLSPTGIGESLFTVHANAERYVAVGGFGTGLILENTGGMWEMVRAPTSPGLVGVHLSDAGGYAIGQEGVIVRYTGDEWVVEDTGINIDQSFHSVWVAPDGGAFAAGGQVLTLPLIDGMLLYRGAANVGEIQ